MINLYTHRHTHSSSSNYNNNNNINDNNNNSNNNCIDPYSVHTHMDGGIPCGVHHV